MEQVAASQVCITPKAVYEAFQSYFDCCDHQVEGDKVLDNIHAKAQKDVKEFLQAQQTLEQLANQVNQIIINSATLATAAAPPNNKGTVKKSKK